MGEKRERVEGMKNDGGGVVYEVNVNKLTMRI